MPVKVLERYDHDRFSLRPFDIADAASFFEASAASREDLRKWIPWVICDSVEDAERVCAKYRGDFDEGREFRFAIVTGSILLGTTCFLLRGTPIENATGEIGMWIRSDWAGRGLATDVLAAMLDWGFRMWGWERLTWKCDTRNIGSVRVAQKCGMVLEGTLRSDLVDSEGNRSDTHIFASLRAEHGPRESTGAG